jgi:hypothetical protein
VLLDAAEDLGAVDLAQDVLGGAHAREREGHAPAVAVEHRQGVEVDVAVVDAGVPAEGGGVQPQVAVRQLHALGPRGGAAGVVDRGGRVLVGGPRRSERRRNAGGRRWRARARPAARTSPRPGRRRARGRRAAGRSASASSCWPVSCRRSSGLGVDAGVEGVDVAVGDVGQGLERIGPWVNRVQIQPRARTSMSARSRRPGGSSRVVLAGRWVTARRVSRRRW